MFDLILSQAQVLVGSSYENAKWQQLDIGIENGKIKNLGDLSQKDSKNKINCQGLHILPGLIDSQVHFRQPGKIEHKEDFWHASKSAVAGGITAVFDMPNTAPPLVSEADLEQKLQEAHQNFWCHYGFYMGASPSNATELKDLERLPHCPGVKMFMGSSTGDLLVWKDEDIESVFKHSYRRMAIHSEDEKRLKERKHLAKDHVKNHMVWRDEQTAIVSTKKIINFSQKYKRPAHILHITTAQELELIKEAKKTNPHLSCECLPQHLFLKAPEVYEQMGTLAQMNPPIRDLQHQEALWKALGEGLIDIIGSDHAPHLLEEKNLPYPQSPSGMPGVQTTLPLLLNAVTEGQLKLKDIARLMAYKPVELFNIEDKGAILEGYDADLTIIDMNKEHELKSKDMHYKCGWTPYENWKVKGLPIGTIIQGKAAYWKGQFGPEPAGQPLNFKV